MTGLRWVQLTDDERDDFLETGGTGVLSFARESDQPPASIPVSYGYAAELEAFYFRLSFPPTTSKGTFVENPASFVTSAQTDAGWRSVVATGTLDEIDDLPYDSATVQGLWGVHIPTVDMFNQPPDEIPFRNFCLEPDRLTGRKEAP